MQVYTTLFKNIYIYIYMLHMYKLGRQTQSDTNNCLVSICDYSFKCLGIIFLLFKICRINITFAIKMWHFLKV